MQINSDDYHDYVIKNGILIGEFEEMYKKSKEIPWHQDKQENLLDIRITIELLKEYSPFDFICDLGCGLGYLLDILYKNIGKNESRMIGCDISKTCCQKAHKLFPLFYFYELDLMQSNSEIMLQIRNVTGEGKKLFVIRGVFWYIFKNMRNVVNNIANIVKDNDLLLISQNFPPLESEFVGKEVIPNPEAIITYFEEYFIPIKSIWLKNYLSEGNENWFLGIFLRKS